MTIDVSTSPSQVRVALAGEFDMARATELRHTLLDIDLGGPDVVADLSAVSFMDSSALHALLSAREWLVADGGSLTLTAVPARVARLFEVTQTADLFGLDAAVA